MRRIELWSDSFHEGDWACKNLSCIHHEQGGKSSSEYRNGFMPVFNYTFEDGKELEITVYGSYNSWEPLPQKIKDLIEWGKPDFLAYSPDEDKILFAVEETAAVPTGNQALQRCERLYGSSRAKIPFWYLLAEYGMHKDGAVRRDSIWPSIMALKLSVYNKKPSAILHYADADNPEGYDFGTGVKVLFSALYQILKNYTYGANPLDKLDDYLKDHYSDMLRFIKSQYKNIIGHLPGEEFLDDEELPKLLAKIAVHGNDKDVFCYHDQYKNFLVWPDVNHWIEISGLTFSSSGLIKQDDFAEGLEASIDEKKCYIIGSNAGSRPQKRASVQKWIDQQQKSFHKYANKLNPSASLDLDINDFPESNSGNLHVTTAKNIVYLFDKFSDVKNIICNAFPRLSGKLDRYDSNQPAFVYISNSLKPGRIFGDPFTGQISAYSTAFGRFDKEKRIIIAYFPHQSFSQILDSKKRKVKNKGFVILREMVDFIIFGGGVLVRFDENGRGIAE